MLINTYKISRFIRKSAADKVLVFWFVVCALGVLVSRAFGAECHFHDKEFACKCCGKILVDKNLIPKLEQLRSALGNNPIVITSGYRCKKHNTEVGGVKHSQHCLGRAVDIKVESKTPEQVAEAAKKLGFTFVKTYASWTHVDIRERS